MKCTGTLPVTKIPAQYGDGNVPSDQFEVPDVCDVPEHSEWLGEPCGMVGAKWIGPGHDDCVGMHPRSNQIKGGPDRWRLRPSAERVMTRRPLLRIV